MTWWIWIIVGFTLLGAEIFLPSGFFAFFFGIAGIITGAIAYVAPDLAPWLYWVIFAVIAVSLIAAFRSALLHTGQKEIKNIANEEVVILEAIEPNQRGTGELHGTRWQVFNRSKKTLTAGSRALVKRVVGVTLEIE